jgi:hypothetical protein
MFTVVGPGIGTRERFHEHALLEPQNHVLVNSQASVKAWTWRTCQLASQCQGLNVAYLLTRKPVSRPERGLLVNSQASVKA